MNYQQLLKAIDTTSQHLAGRIATVANQALVLRNWLVGAHIVEFEQSGKDRARYGERLIQSLAKDLSKRKVRGLGASVLERSRRFYQYYPHLVTALSPAMFEVLKVSIPYSLTTESASQRQKSSPAITSQSPPALGLPAEAIAKLTWTHWMKMIRIEEPLKRAFYELEAFQGRWSVRKLQRQIGSLLFERTGLSKDKAAVVRRARKQSAGKQLSITDMIRDPCVLEFAGLTELPVYTEDDLEQALLDHLQKFLLELGTGFCFEARQKRISVGNTHDYVDLVFYHRVLRCHVLIG